MFDGEVFLTSNSSPVTLSGCYVLFKVSEDELLIKIVEILLHLIFIQHSNFC